MDEDVWAAVSFGIATVIGIVPAVVFVDALTNYIGSILAPIISIPILFAGFMALTGVVYAISLLIRNA